MPAVAQQAFALWCTVGGVIRRIAGNKITLQVRQQLRGSRYVVWIVARVEMSDADLFELAADLLARACEFAVSGAEVPGNARTGGPATFVDLIVEGTECGAVCCLFCRRRQPRLLD